MAKKKQPAAGNQAYRDRDTLLVTMGFESYATYLASELWCNIRARALLHHGNLCRVCNNGDVVLHHLDYTEPTMRGENLGGLIPLCKGCHHKVEFNNKGWKRTFLAVSYAYHKLIKSPLKKLVARNTPLGKRCSCGNMVRKNSSRCGRCRRLQSARRKKKSG